MLQLDSLRRALTHWLAGGIRLPVACTARADFQSKLSAQGKRAGGVITLSGVSPRHMLELIGGILRMFMDAAMAHRAKTIALSHLVHAEIDREGSMLWTAALEHLAGPVGVHAPRLTDLTVNTNPRALRCLVNCSFPQLRHLIIYAMPTKTEAGLNLMRLFMSLPPTLDSLEVAPTRPGLIIDGFYRLPQDPPETVFWEKTPTLTTFICSITTPSGGHFVHPSGNRWGIRHALLGSHQSVTCIGVRGIDAYMRARHNLEPTKSYQHCFEEMDALSEPRGGPQWCHLAYFALISRKRYPKLETIQDLTTDSLRAATAGAPRARALLAQARPTRTEPGGEGATAGARSWPSRCLHTEVPILLSFDAIFLLHVLLRIQTFLLAIMTRRVVFPALARIR